MANPETGARVQTTALSLDIVDALQANDGLKLGEVAETFDIGKSTAHRHLQTLCDRGYVVKDGDTYELGLASLDPGVYARDDHDVYEVGAQYVDRLAEQTGEQVWLLTRQNGHSVVLYREMGTKTLKSSERLGQRRLLHQSAAGKAMLAALPTEEVRSIVRKHGLEPLTENTITDESELFAELERIRDRGGIGFNHEETSVGLQAVSAPIIDEESEVLGAISVSGPANRLKGSVLEQDLPQQLLSVTNEIQVNLRYS
jgi:DNA-binding IclR family transcriptional regulator